MYLTVVADSMPASTVRCPFTPTSKARFPLDKLGIGDGFGMVGGPQDLKALRQATKNYTRRTWRRFEIRKIEAYYWCCWRVS